MAVTTVYTYPLDGSKKDFTVPFEYLARKFVAVTLVGTAGRKVLVLNTDYRFTSKTTIQTTQAWATGSGYTTIEVKRNTSATDRLVSFADGSILKATDMTLSQVQTMHVAEEARNAVSDTISVNGDGMLDARGRRLVNLQSAREGTDAVTYQQVIDWSASALNSANAAAASVQAAANNAAAASASQRTAKSSEDAAYAYQENARNSRDLAGTYSTNAYSSSQSARNFALSSQGSATESYNSATDSRAAANNSANSAATAKSEADRAKTEADKLGNSNSLMATLDSVDASNGWVNWKDGWGLRFYKLNVDRIAGKAADKIYVDAGRMDVKSILGSGRISSPEVGALRSSDPDGARHIINGNGFTATDANGYCWASGESWTQKGLPYFNMQATTASQNLHLWMRGVNFEDRGLIYNEPDGKWVIRTGGQKALILYNDGAFSVPGRLETAFQVWSHKENPGLDANTYGNTNFQAQADNGSVPGYGFHRAGIEAAALVYYSGNLRMRRNDNIEYELIHNGNQMGYLANNMRTDGIGCLASMQNVSGGTVGAGGLLGGDKLRYSTHNSPSGRAAPGTWLTFGDSNNGGVSNWLRIG